MNFQISMTLYFIVSIILLLVVVGIVLLPLLAVLQIVLVILGKVEASKGRVYRYPFTIPFIG